MSEDRKTAVTSDEWSTARAATFMGVSKQTVSAKVRSRRLFGYRDGSAIRIPSWQFDTDARRPHPEIEELLAAFGPDTDLRDAALWSTSPLPDCDATPAELLLAPATKQRALDLARDFVRQGQERTAAGEVAPVGDALADWFREDAADEKSPRTAILRAAAVLFAQKGPSKVSLREVAVAADVPYSLIYRFYRTKENLLVSVMELFVREGGRLLTDAEDVYESVRILFESESAPFGRMLAWAILDGTTPERLFSAEYRSGMYRKQIDDLWKNHRAPQTRDEFDSHVVSALIQLVGLAWELYEPYLTYVEGIERSAADIRGEVTELLELLVYASGPSR